MSVLSAHTEKFTRYDIEAQILTTKEFPHDPRQTEIMARLANPTVNQFMNEPVRGSLGLWNRENPVYMITGLKFAKGKVVFRQVRGETVALRYRHNIADPIIWTDRNQCHNSEHLWEREDETIVAYKLLKIEKNHQRRNDSDDELILSAVLLEGSEWY
jgi:hypothetical protein